MKVTITFDKEQVVQDLIRAVNIIPKKPLVPINEYYMFHVKFNTCDIYASDPSMTLKCSASVESDVEDFKFCVPAILFTDTVKLLREPTFTLTVMDKVCQLKSGKSKYKMPTEDFNYFVMKEEGDRTSEVSVLGAHFKDSFRIATSFIDKKTDNNLKAVNMSIQNNKLVLIGGRTVLLTKHNLAPHSLTKFDEVNIPYSTAVTIQSIFGDKDIVDIYHDGTTAIFSNGSISLSCSTFANKYPNTKSLLDRTGKQFFTISTSYLLDALKRIILYSPDGIYTVIFHVSADKLIITAEQEEFQKFGEEEIEIVSPRELTVGLPAHKLIQMLSSLTEQDTLNSEMIRVYMGEDHKRPVTFTDDNDIPTREFLVSPLMFLTPKK